MPKTENYATIIDSGACLKETVLTLFKFFQLDLL